MPRLVMIATSLIEHYGIDALPGDRLEVTPGEAAALVYRKLARVATPKDLIASVEPEPEPVPEPEPEPELPPAAVSRRRRRGSYRRRDLVAEV